MSRTPVVSGLILVAVLALGGIAWLLFGDRGSSGTGQGPAGGPGGPSPAAEAPGFATEAGPESARLPLPDATRPDAPRGAGAIDTSSAPAIVSGRVTSRGDVPVGDARVQLFAFDGSHLAPVRSTLPLHELTGADGRFRLVGVPPGRNLGVAVEHDDHAPATVEPFRLEAGGLLELPDIVLTEGLALRGVVKTELGVPIPGAQVGLTDLSSVSRTPAPDTIPDPGAETLESPDRTTTTDAEGRYLFLHLGQRQYRVATHADGYGPATIVLSLVLGAPAAGWTQDFTLSRADSRLVIQLVDGPGRPLPDTTLLVTQRRRQNNTFVMLRQATDAQGRAVFEPLPGGLYDVDIASRQYYLDRPAQAPASGDEQLVRALQTRSVSLRLAAEGAPPPADFQLSIRPDGRTGAGLTGGARYEQSVRGSDPPGTALVGSLRPGTYRFEVSAAGFAAATSPDVLLGPEEGPPADVLITLLRGGTLVGRLSAPQEGVPIQLREADWDPSQPLEAVFPTPPLPGLVARTDAQGGFRIEHVPTGSYVLSALPPDAAPLHVRDVAVSDGRTTELAPLVLPRAGTLFGNVIGPDGEPRAGARVTATGFDHQAQAVSDAEGAFRIEGLPPGEYEVQAVPGSLWEALRFGRTEHVVISADKEQGVVLALEARVSQPPN